MALYSRTVTYYLNVPVLNSAVRVHLLNCAHPNHILGEFFAMNMVLSGDPTNVDQIWILSGENSNAKEEFVDKFQHGTIHFSGARTNTVKRFSLTRSTKKEIVVRLLLVYFEQSLSLLSKTLKCCAI